MRTIAALGLLLALTATGCSQGDGMGSTGDLSGRTYLSTGVTEDGADRPLVAGSRIRLTFGEDAVSANAGCNSMSGSARLEAGRLVIPGPLATTEMACDPALMDQDAWLADLLTSSPAAAISGDELTLTAGATVVSLLDRRVADPDRPLAGTAWTLDGLVDGETASSVPEGVVSTLEVTSDGTTLRLRPGCNTGSAAVSVTDTTLTVGPVALTKMACPEPAAGVESAVLAVLQGEVTYAIEAGSLRLTNGDRGLTYRTS